jgi:TonB family protein
MATEKKPAPKPVSPQGNGPGAPKPVVPQPKILRIGVIQAGKIVEERLIRQRNDVTIGASPRNTIVVPASSLPKSFTLFQMHQGKYTLKFSESMDGRVSVGNQVLSLDQVRQQKLAATKGTGVLELGLTEASRGKVLLGEVTLLFQFVTPPPIQPRPQLPPSVRGGFFTNMDWVLASSFVTLLVIHFGFLLYMRTLDFQRKIEPDVVPDRFAEYIPEVKKPDVLDMSKLAKVGEKAAEKAEKAEGPKKGGGKGKAGPAKPCDAACQEAKAAARRARLAEQVSKMGVLKLLGTTGKGSGATANLLGSGDPGTETDKAFAGVGGLTVAGRGGGRGGGLRGKGGGGTGRGVGIGDLGGRVGGPGEVGTGGAVQERVPKAIVKPSRAEIDGTMNTDAVARTIRLGMPAITTCYQRALKRNPKLTGKITVRLSINTMGAVTRVSIEGDSIGDPQVTSCIQGYAQRWRFPPPEGGTAEVSVPFVFQAAL